MNKRTIGLEVTDMKIAEIYVNGVTAVASRVKKIPKGIIGATVKVTFANEWANLAKTAVFQGVVTKDVLVDGNSITIPAECVDKSGYRLRVGFYGVADETLAIPTIWTELGTIRDATDPSGDTSTDPTLPVWAQLQDQVDNMTATTDEQIQEAIDKYLEENPVVGTPGKDGEDGQPGKDGVSATHSWNGTVLTVTSASGTSSADLKGATGNPGKDGVSATHKWSGTTLTITSASGTSSADLKGDKGDSGDDYVLTDMDRAEIAEQAAQMVIDDAPVKSVNGKTGAVTLAATDVGARPSTWTPSATDVGADPKGTANTTVSGHNTNTAAHNDIRLLITALATRLDALANSDDETLDQMAEVVAYIKANRDLIEQVTTGKVNVADIVNNMTTNVTNKPLSAAQGVALKALIDAITVPTKVSQLTNDKGYITGYTETDPTVPSWAKASNKPSYSKSEVGLGNVDNVKQYSASNPPPYPVTSVNGKTGAVTVDVPSVPSWAMATSKPSYTASEVGAVPTSRTVNGKALSGNITLSASDVKARANTWTPSSADIQSALGYKPASQSATIAITGKDSDGNTHTFTVIGWEGGGNEPT